MVRKKCANVRGLVKNNNKNKNTPQKTTIGKQTNKNPPPNPSLLLKPVKKSIYCIFKAN